MVEADFTTLLVLLSFMAGLVGFVWWRIRDVIPFLYPTGVIMAKEAKLLDDSRFEELTLLPLEDFPSFFENTEYGKYIESESYEGIERGLLLFKKDLHYEIFDLIPDKFKDIFVFLMKEWDVINLRTVLTGVHAGLSAEDVRSRLIEEGEMFEKISNLAGEDMEKIASTFEGTPLEVAIGEYNRVKDFSGVDIALGKWVLEDTFTKLDGRRGKGLRVFKRYLEIYTDCLNLKTMLRGKQGGATEEEINRFLLGAEEVTRVYGETEGVSEFLERMRETRYGYLIVEVDEDVMRMEHRIDEAMLRAVKRLSSEEAFGLGQIIRFLTLKDTERRNLKLIAKLKAEGVGIDRIKGMVFRVGEGA